MNAEKVEKLRAWLQKEFKEGGVEFDHSGGFHKFRINMPKTTYWLYISDEFVDDHDVDHVVAKAGDAKIIDAFKNSSKTKYLFLGEGVAKEVDENFTKPKIT